MDAVELLARLLDGLRRPRLDHRKVIGPVLLADLDGEEHVAGLPEKTACRDSEEVFKRLVGEDEPAFQVRRVDERVRRVGDSFEKQLVAVRRVVHLRVHLIVRVAIRAPEARQPL